MKWYDDQGTQRKTPTIEELTAGITDIGPEEAEWLKEWREGQTSQVETWKSEYETELAKEMAEWENLAQSTRWLRPEEFQDYVAAKSYETARTQEIADWYKEQMAILETQGEELEGVAKLQSNMDVQTAKLQSVLSALNTELEKPSSLEAVQSRTQEFITEVEKQKTSLTAYRDWLGKQGVTPEDEIAKAKEQGLPEDEWVSTDDRIRELDKLIQWAKDVQTQLRADRAGPTWKPWTSEFWRERALGFLLNTALPKLEWVDASWSIMAAQLLEELDRLTGHQWGTTTLFGQAATPEYTELTKWEWQTIKSGIPGVAFTLYLPKTDPFSREAHEVWKSEADPTAQNILAIVNPAWLIPYEKVAAEALQGLRVISRGGIIGGEKASSLITRLALRNAEIERLAIEGGLELRGFKNAIAISGRTPGLVEHYLPQITRGTRVAVRGIYLPVEVAARVTLTAVKDIAWIGKNMVVWGWKIATAPIKTVAWALERGIWRPAMSRLGKLAIPESIKTLAASGGYEVTLLPRAEQIGKGMLFRVTNREHFIDVMVKNQDELMHLLQTGELMPAEMERYYVEQTGKVLTYQELKETPVVGNVWAERAFRLSTRPVGMSEEVWSRGFKALRVDSMERVVRPAQMIEQFPTIEKFMGNAMEETPVRRALVSLLNREWLQGNMRGVPGLRALIMKLDPVASEIARAAQAWRNMQEALEVWKTSRLAAARQCQRFQIEVVRRDIGKGEFITELIVKNVKARDGKAIPYIGDVLEHPDRFIMSDELRVARDTYCAIIDEAKAGLKRFGIEINELGFEEGGHYFPRYVLGKNKELLTAASSRPGGFMTKASFEKTRVFQEMAEGIQKGYIYEENPLVVLDAHLDAACHRIADQEFYRLMKPRGLTQTEIVDYLAPGLRKMVEAGREKIKALDRIDKIVKIMSAVEPRRAPKAATMRMIRKHAPDVWLELRTVRQQATAEEKILRSTLQKYADTFKELKWKLESLQTSKAAAEEMATAAQQEAREAIEQLTKTLNELAEQPLSQFPLEEKLKDILCCLPDEVKAQWKASVDMLYDDAAEVASGYQAELETAIESLKDDPVYSRTVQYGQTTTKKVVDGKTVIVSGKLRDVNLPGLLLKRSGKDAGRIPETITIQQYRSLYGRYPNDAICKIVGKEKRVMIEYAFDEIAEEFGMSSDEFIQHINDYPRLRQHVWELERDAALANEACERLVAVWRVFREEEAEAAEAIRIAQAGEYARPVEAAAPAAEAIKLEVPEVKLPVQEPGMPEAGIQADIFGGKTVVRPEGKGEVVQASMEDLAKYQEAMGGKPAELPTEVTPPSKPTPAPGVESPKPEAGGEVPPKGPTVKDITFPERPPAPEVKPSKDWWKRVRLMSENKLKDARLRQAQMETDLARVRARAQHPEPFGGGTLFKGERAVQINKDKAKTYAFQGTWFPESVANLLEKQLGDRGIGWVEKISDVSGVARMLMTGLDFGGGMIQGLPVLLMRPDIWFKAQMEAFEALRNPKRAYAYFNLPSSREVIRESIMAGKPIVISGSEFTETMGRGGLGRKLLSPPGLKQTVRPAFERAALAFDIFGSAARIEMYKALRPMAKNPEEILDLVDFINKMTGVRSGVVAGATQRQIEGSLLLFAPRYFRATVSLMFDVFRGGLKGSLARRMMASMLASGALFYYGVCKALGQEPNFDPRSSKFLTVELGGSHIGFGSIWVAMARMFAGVVATASDKPGDLLKFSRDDNPLAQFIAGRLAPLTGSALDIIVGKTYIGENLEDPNDFLGKDWGKIGKEVIARNLLPFWLDAQLTENPRPGLASVPAEIFGFRSWALQPWERRNKLRDYYAMQEFGVTWEELRLEKPKNNEKALMASTWGVDAQKYLEGKYEDLAKITAEARQAVLKRGKAFDALYDEWSQQFERENERVATLLQRAADEFKYNLALRDRLYAGDTTLTEDEKTKAETAGQIFRDTVGQIRDNHRYWRQSLEQDPKYAEVYAQLDKWREESAESLQKQGLTEYVGDRAYQAYISLMYETTGLEDQFGKFDYDEYDRRKSEWLSTWGYDMWEYCQKRLATGKQEPPVVAELRKARQVLKPYWALQEKITQRLQGKYPQTAEEKQKMVRAEVTNRLNKISAGIGDLYASDPDMLGSVWRTKGGKIWKGIIAKVRAQVDKDLMLIDTAIQRVRDQMRRDNPDVDFYLRLFYDRKPLDEEEIPLRIPLALQGL